MIPMLTQLDPKVLIGIAVVSCVLFVISLIKKAFKVAVTLLIVSLLFGAGVPSLNQLKENYNIHYSQQTEELSIKVAGKNFVIPVKEMRESRDYSIVVTRGTKSTKIGMTYTTKDGRVLSAVGSDALELPNFMLDYVLKYLDNNGLKYTEESNSLIPDTGLGQ